MSTPETLLDGPLSEWYWEVSLQWVPPAGGISFGTATGAAVVPLSDTTRDVRDGVMAEARRRLKVPAGTEATVLFRSIEPMALADRGRS